jgi:hypothetical protein
MVHAGGDAQIRLARKNPDEQLGAYCILGRLELKIENRSANANRGQPLSRELSNLSLEFGPSTRFVLPLRTILAPLSSSVWITSSRMTPP